MRVVKQNLLLQVKEKDPTTGKQILVSKIVQKENELSHYRGTVLNFNFTESKTYLQKNPDQCFVTFEEFRQLEERYFQLAKKYIKRGKKS